MGARGDRRSEVVALHRRHDRQGHDHHEREDRREDRHHREGDDQQYEIAEHDRQEGEEGQEPRTGREDCADEESCRIRRVFAEIFWSYLVLIESLTLADMLRSDATAAAVLQEVATAAQ